MDNYRKIVDSSREMFDLWLSLKRSEQSEHELSLALAEAYRDYPGVTSQWILFFAGCLWALDPTYFDALLDDLVYLPWLVASLLTGVRLSRLKWFEIALLGFALLLLLATYSRGGLLAAVLALVLTFLAAGRNELRAAWKWFVSGFRSAGGLLLRLGVFAIALGALAGAVFFLAQKGYIARLFNTRADDLQEFVIANSAGARAAYMFGALGAYEESPITGVGLGASGFYIYKHMPDWAMTTVPDIARQFSPENRLYPNPPHRGRGKNDFLPSRVLKAILLSRRITAGFSLCMHRLESLCYHLTATRYCKEMAVRAHLTWQDRVAKMRLGVLRQFQSVKAGVMGKVVA